MNESPVDSSINSHDLPEGLHDRIMTAVRSTRRPLTRRQVRTRRLFAAGGGTAFAAVALMLGAAHLFQEPTKESPSASRELHVADSAEILLPLASWQLVTPEVSAFTTAVDGASAEATRTAFSMLHQAGSGLRLFVPASESQLNPEEQRSEHLDESDLHRLA